jgi:hypothetical protein
MPQIFNPANSLDPQQAVTLDANIVTANTSSSSPEAANEYVPHRLLKNSVASSSADGSSDFSALSSDIPDAFATYEQPKLKFLFTVSFTPRTSVLNLKETGADDMDSLRFALKRATRPSPTVVYQDMNFYGMRTKVAIKMDYGTVTLTFYDDVVNNAHSLVSRYINSISPISTQTALNADNLDVFSANNKTIGALAHKMGPFQSMKVTHHMLDNSLSDVTTPKQVYYEYLNPKIINVNLDELDMTQSDTTNVEIVFVYDSVNISYSDESSPNPNTSTESSNGTGSVPIVKGIVNSFDDNSNFVGNGLNGGIGGLNVGNNFGNF